VEIFEEFGGCLAIAAAVAVVLALVACVAVVVFGATLSDWIGWIG